MSNKEENLTPYIYGMRHQRQCGCKFCSCYKLCNAFLSVNDMEFYHATNFPHDKLISMECALMSKCASKFPLYYRELKNGSLKITIQTLNLSYF